MSRFHHCCISSKVCVCVCICIYRGTVDRGSGRCASHSTLLICPLLRVECTPWVLGCSFIEALPSVTSIAVSQSTPAYGKPCPSRALGRGSLGLAERPSHTRSTNPTLSTFTSTPQPERGPALRSKKGNNSLYQKMSLILPRNGSRLRSIEAFHDIPEIFSE